MTFKQTLKENAEEVGKASFGGMFLSGVLWQVKDIAPAKFGVYFFLAMMLVFTAIGKSEDESSGDTDGIVDEVLDEL